MAATPVEPDATGWARGGLPSSMKRQFQSNSSIRLKPDIQNVCVYLGASAVRELFSRERFHYFSAIGG
jgi:hypothetical protein